MAPQLVSTPELSCGGIDTLKVSVYGRFASIYKDTLWLRIKRAQENAQKKDAHPEELLVELPCGRLAHVNPRGQGKGEGWLPFSLEVDGVTIGLGGPMATEGERIAGVELGSELLMKIGHQRAWGLACEILEDLGVIQTENVVGRADLCVDLPGVPVQQFCELFRQRWYICRAKYWSDHGQGHRDTGFVIGKANCMLRVYDKLEEMQKNVGDSKFAVIRDQRWGGVIPQHATRVEFQMRRQLLKRLNIDSVDELFQSLGDCSVWLAEEWCRFTDEDPDAANRNQNRARTAKLWHDVRDAFLQWTGKVNYKLRRRVDELPDQQQLEKQMVGIAETLVACSPDYVRDPHELTGVVLNAIKKVWSDRKKGDGCRHRIAKKREKLRALGKWDIYAGLQDGPDPYPEFSEAYGDASVNEESDQQTLRDLDPHQLQAWSTHDADCFCDECRASDGIGLGAQVRPYEKERSGQISLWD